MCNSYPNHDREQEGFGRSYSVRLLRFFEDRAGFLVVRDLVVEVLQVGQLVGGYQHIFTS